MHKSCWFCCIGALTLVCASSQAVSEQRMTARGVRDRVHTELMSSDRFITLGLVPALLRLGELTQLQGSSREG